MAYVYPKWCDCKIFRRTSGFKGGYLDFSHLIELKIIHIAEIHMKKQYENF